MADCDFMISANHTHTHTQNLSRKDRNNQEPSFAAVDINIWSLKQTVNHVQIEFTPFRLNAAKRVERKSNFVVILLTNSFFGNLRGGSFNELPWNSVSTPDNIAHCVRANVYFSSPRTCSHTHCTTQSNLNVRKLPSASFQSSH